MRALQPAHVVGLDQRISGTPDCAADPECAQQAARHRRLAGTQFAAQEEEYAVLDGTGEDRGERRAQRIGRCDVGQGQDHWLNGHGSPEALRAADANALLYPFVATPSLPPSRKARHTP